MEPCDLAKMQSIFFFLWTIARLYSGMGCGTGLPVILVTAPKRGGHTWEHCPHLMNECFLTGWLLSDLTDGGCQCALFLDTQLTPLYTAPSLTE